ncbi:MW1434 family type I TA system toxin [Ligilactobacillus saerimneri]|uniref:Thoeris anti-defense Tad2 family protein n=1 Tax=Ligilactobacillus saerimneri TaxID=228229 RepID=UPI002943A942|nr:MW1434 family type I TA system toxin [Ligilactobacillus saerimneri]
MTIIEAINAADNEDLIRRKSWRGSSLRIKPTDSESCCELYSDDKFLSKRWNPYKKDLIANDWMIVK